MNKAEGAIAALGLSAAVAACGTGAEASPKPSPTATPRQTHTEVIVGACPPGYVAPWEAQPSKKPTSQGEIMLVSFVKPQPTPDMNPVECFYEVEVEGPAPEPTEAPWTPAPSATAEAIQTN